jgi:hypothetical protein
MANDPFFLDVDLSGLRHENMMVNATDVQGTAYGVAPLSDTASAISITTSTNAPHDMSISNLNGWSPSEMLWIHSNDAPWRAMPVTAAGTGPLCDSTEDGMGSDKMDFLSMNNIALEASLSADLFHAAMDPAQQLPGTQHHDKAPMSSNEFRTLVADPNGSPSSSICAATIPFNLTAVRPSSTLSRMPSLLKEPIRETRIPIVDNHTYDRFLADFNSRLPPGTETETSLTRQEIQRFLNSYFLCYNQHCPIIHLPTFDLKTTPSHLILSICAIGALYRLNRQKAHNLWRCANDMIEKVVVSRLLIISGFY